MTPRKKRFEDSRPKLGDVDQAETKEESKDLEEKLLSKKYRPKPEEA